MSRNIIFGLCYVILCGLLFSACSLSTESKIKRWCKKISRKDKYEGITIIFSEGNESLSNKELTVFLPRFNNPVSDVKELLQNIKFDYLNFIESLQLGVYTKSNYQKVDIVFRTNFQFFSVNRKIYEDTFVLKSSGEVINRLFLSKFDMGEKSEQELEKICKNYKHLWKESGPQKQPDGTYIQEFYIENLNQDIPLYIDYSSIILFGKRKGDIDYRKLWQGDDYKSLKPAHNGIILPLQKIAFRIQLSKYCAESYDNLTCEYEVEIGFYEE